MKKSPNPTIDKALRIAGVYNYQLQHALGISGMTYYRRMYAGLSDEELAHWLSVIKELSSEEE